MILDRNSGAFNTASVVTVTRSTGSFGTGTVLVVAIFGNTTFGSNPGWTQRTNSVVDLGLYAYDKAGAGESSVGFIVSGGAGSGVWFCWELSAGSTWLTGQANQSNAGATVHTAAAVTPTAGARHLLLAIGGVGAGNARTVTAIDSSFAEWSDNQVSAQDWPFAAGADVDVTADGSTGYAPTATFSGGTQTARGAVLLAYGNAGGASAITLSSLPAGAVSAGVPATFSVGVVLAVQPGGGRPGGLLTEWVPGARLGSLAAGSGPSGSPPTAVLAGGVLAGAPGGAQPAGVLATITLGSLGALVLTAQPAGASAAGSLAHLALGVALAAGAGGAWPSRSSVVLGIGFALVAQPGGSAPPSAPSATVLHGVQLGVLVGGARPGSRAVTLTVATPGGATSSPTSPIRTATLPRTISTVSRERTQSSS